jgi:hypothetical protein
MLLLPEFPWKAFVGLDKLAWLRWKNHGDMPGFLFSPAPSNSDLLGSLLLNELGKDADLIDTTALREVAKMLGPEVTYLPIGPEITKYNERFGNWIFDPLAYGAYLFGVDPRNHWGLLRRQVLYPNDSVVDPTFAKFNLSGKALSVVFPASSTPFRLASLHVHAKNRFLFKSSFHRLALGFAVMLANKKCLRVAFRPAAFFEALCETLKAAKRKLRTGKKN